MFRTSFIAAFVVATILSSTSPALAAEKKTFKDVDLTAFIKDTQIALQAGVDEGGTNHIAIAWWVPIEYWEVVLSKDASVTPQDKQNLLDALQGTSLLAVVQADVTARGAFQFYSKEEVEKTMELKIPDDTGKLQKVKPIDAVSPELKTMLTVVKPILGNAMGNLGTNMHFYVLNDVRDDSDRVLSPYTSSQIDIKLLRRDGKVREASIPTPINSLFVPRKCPNGRDAHITWKYCPWTGQPLED